VQAAAAAAQKPPPSRLGAVKRGSLAHPLRHLLYGSEGIGKSTLAKHAPNPIWFDCENGTAQLDLARYLFRDDELGHVPASMAEVYAAIEDLRVSEHGFQTLVLDTVDAMEVLVHRHVCDRESGKKSTLNKSGKAFHSIEDFGFGKGFNLAIDEWRLLCHQLDRLRIQRGMGIILLGHSVIRTYKNPVGEDFDRFQLRVHDKSAGFLREWSDIVGYCAFEDGASKLDGEDSRDRPRGYTTGRRLIHLERTAAWDAKARVPMPAEVEIQVENPWAPFAAALEQGRNTTADALATLIEAELARLSDPETTAKARTAMESAAGDRSTLSRFLNALKIREAKEPQ
jgi:hypothetical protein